MAERIYKQPNLNGEVNHILENGPKADNLVRATSDLISLAGSPYLDRLRYREVSSGLGKLEAQLTSDNFQDGVESSKELSQFLLEGGNFQWWDIETYRDIMQRVYAVTSSGQFVAVGGEFALNRIAGRGPLAVMNDFGIDFFNDEGNEGYFVDALTNATVTNLGQGYPPHILAVTAITRLTGGAQCPPYHPGPLMDVAAEAMLSVAPIPTEGAKVAWFNSGGAAISVAMRAAEKYIKKGEDDSTIRKAIYFREAYHGNIEGGAGGVTTGINESVPAGEGKHYELEFPNLDSEVEPVLNAMEDLIVKDRVSSIVMESTQGDGGGVSMHPVFFNEMMKMSLDFGVPIVVDEVQSGFGRSGRVFDIEYFLDYWRNSNYVQNEGYPAEPPFILAVAKSMTNGASSGSAVVFPKEYAVLARAQGLNTYSAHPASLAAAISTVDLMQPELLEKVMQSREAFDTAIAPYVGENRLIKGTRGHGLHLFLGLANNYNQRMQIELLGRKRVLTGTVSRDGLRIHAPINAPEIVWQMLGEVIGQTAAEMEAGYISPQTLQILQSGTSGLAAR